MLKFQLNLAAILKFLNTSTSWDLDISLPNKNFDKQ